VTAWIVNASPLILLGKINHLDLLENLCPSFGIPSAVLMEILAGPDHDAAKLWIQKPSISARVLHNQPTPEEVIAWDLGAGETAVISLALAIPSSICVLDDLAARNCAEVFQLPVIGTLGILLKAKVAGIIPRLQPEIDQLVSAGSMLSPAVIQKALALSGEIS
jgi:predicted nucleic acid-binding protein